MDLVVAGPWPGSPGRVRPAPLRAVLTAEGLETTGRRSRPCDREVLRERARRRLALRAGRAVRRLLPLRAAARVRGLGLELSQRVDRPRPDPHLEVQVRPVEFPLEPTWPMRWPDWTYWPDADWTLERCAYIVRVPPPCAIVTSLPQPPALKPAKVTRPDAAAATMFPGCCDSRSSCGSGCRVDRSVAVRTRHRRREPDRAARRRHPERRDQPRPRRRRQPAGRPSAGTCAAPCPWSTELPVQLARRKPVRGQGERQRCDVPAVRARRQDPTAETGALPELPEGLLRARAWDAVDGQASAALKLSHARNGAGTEHAVHGSGAERPLPKPDLEGRIRITTAHAGARAGAKRVATAVLFITCTSLERGTCACIGR